jgi:L-threonylcarbamoyladenylate synthase
MLAEVAALPLPPLAQKLIDRFWPGPLSIVVNKSSNIPDLVTAGMPSVAIRMPNHPITLELLNQCQMPIAAPSANMFGAISATTANAVQQEFGSRCPFLLDGGPCSVGLESTVISFLSEPPLLLRPGGIPLEEIQAVIGTVLIPDDQKQQQLSPGRLNSHYAPRTPLYCWKIRSTHSKPNTHKHGQL